MLSISKKHTKTLDSVHGSRTVQLEGKALAGDAPQLDGHRHVSRKDCRKLAASLEASE